MFVVNNASANARHVSVLGRVKWQYLYFRHYIVALALIVHTHTYSLTGMVGLTVARQNE